MTKRIFITVAGWEPRFIEGCKNDLEIFSPNTVLIFFSSEYEDWTLANREAMRELCHVKNIHLVESAHVFRDQAQSFGSVNTVLEEVIRDDASLVRFNSTTAPRDIIWSVLHYLNTKDVRTEFSYYRAKSYGAWLSRDAASPRLVIKRSGVMFPDLPTCLLVLSGYDDHRLDQLVRKFEPRLVLLGVQTGEQLKNKERNCPEIKDLGEKVIRFDFDCFDTSAQSIDFLLGKIKPLIGEYNIIAASLGPKPSALTLFRLTNKSPHVGLVYIPAQEYNHEYSEGTDLSNFTVAEV